MQIDKIALIYMFYLLMLWIQTFTAKEYLLESERLLAFHLTIIINSSLLHN